MEARAPASGEFEALSDFVGALTTEATHESLLEMLAERLVLGLSARCATIGLHRQGGLETFAAYPSADRRVCDLQHDGAGSPAATAYGEHRVLAVDDLSTQSPNHWPEYARQAVALGAPSVLSLPLDAGADYAGAVSVVALAREWTTAEVALARAMTDLVTVVVEATEDARRNAVRADQLQRALDRRVVIEQAKGVLAAAEGISIELAYDRLRSFARSHGARVADVAQAVVTLGLRPDAS